MEKSDWDDLFVMSGWNGHSASDAFLTYKTFKERFKSLPKKELIERGWIKDKNDFLALYEYYKSLNWQKDTTLFRKLDAADSLCLLTGSLRTCFALLNN